MTELEKVLYKALYDSLDDRMRDLRPHDEYDLDEYREYFNQEHPVFSELTNVINIIFDSGNRELITFILDHELYANRTGYIEKLFYERVVSLMPELAETLKYTYRSCYVFFDYTMDDFIKRIRINGGPCEDMMFFADMTNKTDLSVLLWKIYQPHPSKEYYGFSPYMHNRVISFIRDTKLFNAVVGRQVLFLQFNGILQYQAETDITPIRKNLDYIKLKNGSILASNLPSRNDIYLITSILNILDGKLTDLEPELTDYEYIINLLKILYKPNDRKTVELVLSMRPDLLCCAELQLQVEFATNARCLDYCTPLAVISIRERAKLVYIRNLLSGFDISDIAKFL